MSKRKFVITVQYQSGRTEHYKAEDERHKDRLVKNLSEMPTVLNVKASEARK